MPIKKKTPGASIRVEVNIKNLSDFKATIWAGASILDARALVSLLIAVLHAHGEHLLSTP